jgi:hypothetical protein
VWLGVKVFRVVAEVTAVWKNVIFFRVEFS